MDGNGKQSQAPGGDEPRPADQPQPAGETGPEQPRGRFQFSLRTLLASATLIALVFASLEWGDDRLLGILFALALVEAGVAAGTPLVPVLVRNLIAYFACLVVFGLVGFGLMFGASPTGWYGTDRFAFEPLTPAAKKPGVRADAFLPLTKETRRKLFSLAMAGDESFPVYEEPYWSFYRDFSPRRFFLLQAMWCAVVAVVAHRALSGRARLPAYLVVWAGTAGLVYAAFGAWAWGRYWAGNGWLERMHFFDTGGASVVWSTAGWAALAAALVFRPPWRENPHRLGLLAGGAVRPLLTLGLVALWVVLGPVHLEELVPVLTSGVYAQSWQPVLGRPEQYLGSAAGLVGAAIVSLFLTRRLHLPLIASGAIGGLIATWSAEYQIDLPWLGLTGLAAGWLVVAATWLLDRLRIDDPAGAVAVCGVCGAWGTVAMGLFMETHGWIDGGPQLRAQLIGTAANFLWVFPASLVLAAIARWIGGRRAAASVAPVAAVG